MTEGAIDVVFVMPDLGEGLEEGTVVEWLVAVGDTVELNQPFVEVETAKAAVEIPAPFAGRIAALHGGVGDVVPVGAPLVTFAVRGGAQSHTATMDRSAAPRATPRVRKLAKELGVNLATVAGTGAEGRIVEDDVRAARGGGSSTRRVLAANLERQAAIPHVTTFRTVDCGALQAFRADLGLSPLSILVAAVAGTAGIHPLLTAAWDGDRATMRPDVNVGLAVDSERGLVVPVLHAAEAKGLSAIAEEIRALADGARAGTLAPEELSGATIAISNTGSYGSEAGTPILAPGTSVTLALGVIADRALVLDGVVVARPAATISLTFDHRVLDGAAAGRALTDLVALLQSPERLGELPR
ncbi:MAG: dihydrolipoamide acetyltransferase family protein [Actinomycetota bacterium]